LNDDVEGRLSLFLRLPRSGGFIGSWSV